MTPRPHRAVLFALVMTLLSTSCKTTDPIMVDNNLFFAERTWQARKPLSYDLTISTDCFCGYEEPGPVVVAVRNGIVASRTYLLTGHLVGASAPMYPTVDDLFAIIEQAAMDHAERLEAYYDQTFGFPVRVAIDPKIIVADDEVFYTVANFQPR